jgi:hypothetical protein
MPSYTSAQDLLATGETGLFLFTDGRFFEVNGSSGSSGFWVLDDPQRPFQRVVVFKWTIRNGLRQVELFSASPDGLEGPEATGKFRGRYKVRLRELSLVGTTSATWEDFASSDGLPVAYVKRENAI